MFSYTGMKGTVHLFWRPRLKVNAYSTAMVVSVYIILRSGEKTNKLAAYTVIHVAFQGFLHVWLTNFSIMYAATTMMI